MDAVDNGQKIAVGIDFSNEAAQISYAPVQGKEAQTLSAIAGSSKFLIPVVLCKKVHINQWTYGFEAERIANEDGNVFVSDFYRKAMQKEIIEIDGESYEAIELLALYLKKLLSLLTLHMPLEAVSGITITVEKLDHVILDTLKEVCGKLHLDGDKINFQTYEESIYYYLLNQPEELWHRDVLILDYSADYLKAYRFTTNYRTTPIVSYTESYHFKHLLMPEQMLGKGNLEESEQELDEKVQESIMKIVSTHIISTVYLIGDGFEGEWPKQTIQLVCRNRRVFQGKNLYTKGACYAARERILQGQSGKKHVFLGRDTLKNNIGAYILKKGKDSYYPFMDAGENWYDVIKESDFILDGDPVINIVVTPVNGSKQYSIAVDIHELPIRPNRATRIGIKLSMKSEKTLLVEIKDKGFGAFYPASGRVWKKEVELQQERENVL